MGSTFQRRIRIIFPAFLELNRKQNEKGFVLMRVYAYVITRAHHYLVIPCYVLFFHR